MVEMENIKQCFLSAAKGKTTRNDVARVLKPERDEGNTNPEPDCLQEHVEELQRQLITETWKPSKHRPRKINEHSCGKVRDIIKPDYKYEQVVHHCVVKQLQPIVLRGLYEHALGSIPERGTHSGKRTLEKMLRKYKGKKLYVLKVDVRHCFETEDIAVIERKLAEIIKDDRFLRLCFRILESEAKWTTDEFLKDGEHLDLQDEERLKGIPLGFFTSQWVMQLNFKSIMCYSTHPREMDLNDIGARNAAQMLSSGQWKFVNVPTKIYPMSKFDQAQEELETKYGKYMKALIDMRTVDGEPYIL